MQQLQLQTSTCCGEIGTSELFIILCSYTGDSLRENRPSLHLLVIVKIPVSKVLINITSFCLRMGRLYYLAELGLLSIEFNNYM